MCSKSSWAWSVPAPSTGHSSPERTSISESLLVCTTTHLSCLVKPSALSSGFEVLHVHHESSLLLRQGNFLASAVVDDVRTSLLTGENFSVSFGPRSLRPTPNGFPTSVTWEQHVVDAAETFLSEANLPSHRSSPFWLHSPRRTLTPILLASPSIKSSRSSIPFGITDSAAPEPIVTFPLPADLSRSVVPTLPITFLWHQHLEPTQNRPFLKAR